MFVITELLVNNPLGNTKLKSTMVGWPLVALCSYKFHEKLANGSKLFAGVRGHTHKHTYMMIPQAYQETSPLVPAK
jgi:hypothetical protein